jgi:outer membrane lipoprotein carrier protein
VAFVTIALLAALPAASGAESAPRSAAEFLAQRIEERQAAARDLVARFVQTFRSGTLRRTLVERGELKLKRPGRVRFEYQDPERKTFVSDGRRYYFYVPADKQVVVREQGHERSLVTLLLSGRSGILAEFAAELAEGVPGRTRLRLTPHTPDPEVARVFLEVDGEHRIRAIEVEDAQGGQSRFEFDAIRENVGLPDTLFRFEIPRGVEVVEG